MRPTREQSRQQTKERLIESAHQAIVRGGIAGLSLRRLCEEAGHSQGAFYSNFDSRDDLLLEIMERHVRAEINELRNLIEATSETDMDGALTAVAVRLAELSQATQWSLLAIELQLHAQRDTSFAAAYDACKATYLTEFALLISDIIDRHGRSPILPPLQIAIGLYALWSGLIVQGTVAGALPRDQMLMTFFRAAIDVCAKE